jgi:hypothetical protein
MFVVNTAYVYIIQVIIQQPPMIANELYPIYSDRILSKIQTQKLVEGLMDYKSTPHIEWLDLGKKVRVYDWHFNTRQYIEWNHMSYLETKLHLFGANYYGVFCDDAIRGGMYKIAESIASRCVGVGISLSTIEYKVDLAMGNIDTYELEPNDQIRFIKNPYYTGKKSSVNTYTRKHKKDNTAYGIRAYLEDYDYNLKGLITYGRLAKDLNISEITIKRYMKDGCLKNLYRAVKKSIILK